MIEKKCQKMSNMTGITKLLTVESNRRLTSIKESMKY